MVPGGQILDLLLFELEWPNIAPQLPTPGVGIFWDPFIKLYHLTYNFKIWHGYM